MMSSICDSITLLRSHSPRILRLLPELSDTSGEGARGRRIGELGETGLLFAACARSRRRSRRGEVRAGDCGAGWRMVEDVDDRKVRVSLGGLGGGKGR
jgi:hypothetical protein